MTTQKRVRREKIGSGAITKRARTRIRKRVRNTTKMMTTKRKRYLSRHGHVSIAIEKCSSHSTAPKPNSGCH